MNMNQESFKQFVGLGDSKRPAISVFGGLPGGDASGLLFLDNQAHFCLCILLSDRKHRFAFFLIHNFNGQK